MMWDQVDQKLVASVKKDLVTMISGLIKISVLLNSAYGQSGVVPKLFNVFLHVLSSKPTVLHVKYVVKEIVEIVANDIQLELSSDRLDELIEELVVLTGLQAEYMLVNLADKNLTPENVNNDDEKLMHFYKTMHLHLGEKGGSLRMFSYTFHKWILQILMTVIRETRQRAYVNFKLDWENVNPLTIENEKEMEEDDEQMEDENEMENDVEEMEAQEQSEEQVVEHKDAAPPVKKHGIGRGNWKIKVPLSEEHKQMVREIFLSNGSKRPSRPTIEKKIKDLHDTLGLDDDYNIAIRAEIRGLFPKQPKEDDPERRRSARSQPKPNYLVL